MFFWWVMPVAAAEPQVAVEAPAFASDVDAEVAEARLLLADKKFEEAARRFGALADAGGNAELRYLQALASYEAGDLRLAQRAVELGLKKSGDSAEFLSLYGLIQADTGNGDGAIKTFDKALSLVTDNETRARVRLNRGIVYLDQGQVVLAEKDFLAAKEDADLSAAADLQTRVAENLGVVAALRGSSGARDPLGQIAEKLRVGDVAGARSVVPPTPLGRREQIEAWLAEGAVSRAEGRMDAAVAAFERALGLAREGGLVRDTSYALAQIGVVYGLQGRYPLALDRLQEAVGLVGGTSFRVNELSYRIEAGRVAVRLGDFEQAKAQLAAVREVSRGLEDPLGIARAGELEGLLLASTGDLDGAVAAFSGAKTAFEGRGYWAEAARIATALVEVRAGTAGVDSAKSDAQELFRKSGDPVGPAHVAFSEGLGLWRMKQSEPALKAFAEATRLGESVGTDRGRQVARVAKENAALLLRAMGRTEEAIARGGGLEAAVADADAFQKYGESYEKGRALFDARRFEEAEQQFAEAEKGFSALKEVAYARRAAVAGGWARYNEAIGAPGPDAFRTWMALAEQGRGWEEPDLAIRAQAAAALKASELNLKEALGLLRKSAPEVERMGFQSLAVQTWAELAIKETALDDRVIAARRSFSLGNGDATGVYAMYSAAVDAYNAGENALALSLVEQALPNAGDLGDELIAVRDAATAAVP